MRLLGVLVTFHRPAQLRVTMDRIAAQSRPLDQLVVVDNGSDPETAALIHELEAESAARYVDAGSNLGPAGGFALGMERLLAGAADDDWIVLLDDDDPPFFDDAFEGIARFAEEMVERDPRTGAVGISGGRFDRRRGVVVRIGDELIHGAVSVDHITGGGLPAYRVSVVRDVGYPLEELFFGFEELEYGLRMTDAGYRLYADGEVWRRRKGVKRDLGLLPSEEESLERRAKVRIAVSVPPWRRYYSLRNLISILRSDRRTWTAIKVSVGRGLVKPVVTLFVEPDGAWENLKLSWRAVWDGWTRRMGRTVDPG